MSDKNHVVGVDGSKRGHAITHDGEESHQHVVDNIDDIELLRADVDPTNEKEHPGETEEGDEGGVKSNQKPKWLPDVFPKCFHAALELGSLRM